MAKTVKVENGDTIKVHYKGTLETGQMFDCSEGRDPLEFEVGAGKVIKGFEKAVLGMAQDEEKEVKIEPGDAYGSLIDKLQQWAPSNLLGETKPVAGMVLQMKTEDGRLLNCMVKSIDGDKMLLDFNHPLAGKPLIFKFKVVEIKKKSGSAAKKSK
jgi:FKBP-type peptidyl-prolyl cis-trans isomerase 2